MSVSGFICGFAAFVYTFFIVIEALVRENAVPGWASLAVLITFFSGLILISFGILGEYLWRIYDEVKDRPRYLIKEKK